MGLMDIYSKLGAVVRASEGLELRSRLWPFMGWGQKFLNRCVVENINPSSPAAAYKVKEKLFLDRKLVRGL